MNKMLIHFTKAADLMSISQASIKLGISQPALSKSIRALEKKLDVTLIERHPRGIRLTPEGEIVYMRAQKIEFEMQAIERDIHTLQHNQQTLNIGAGPAWQKPITSILPEFLRRFPNVNVCIQAAPISQLITPLIEDNLDLAFGGENGQELLKNNGLAFTPMMDSHLRVIARKEHPLNINRVHQISALSHFPWIAFQASSEILNHVNNLLEREGGTRVRYILETEFLEMALEMVKNTDALLCISDQLFKQMDTDGLVSLNLSEPIWHFHLGAWAKPKETRSLLVNEFLNLLNNNLNAFQE
ncbi:LysR family transcriptional regulator [Marinomonas arenicola]|uniref:LysR substrate-binding domain-containing protein n=1 Tax=Marinomonas TaxID=28253 RepID=UPI001054746E|nr:LysR family transcriptional regulator [Marinomonas sp. KMM3893]